MSGRGETGLRARLPELRRTWLWLVAVALGVIGPDVREDLLRHHRQKSRVWWFFGPVLVPAAFTEPVLGLVHEGRLTTIGLVLVGIAIGVGIVEEGRRQRRVVDAIRSRPTA